MCTTAHRRRHRGTTRYYEVLRGTKKKNRRTTRYYEVLRRTTAYYDVLRLYQGVTAQGGLLFSRKNIVKNLSLSFLKVYHTNNFFFVGCVRSTSKETSVVLPCTTRCHEVLRGATRYYGVLRRTTTYYEVLGGIHLVKKTYYGVLRGTINKKRRTTRYYVVLHCTTLVLGSHCPRGPLIFPKKILIKICR